MLAAIDLARTSLHLETYIVRQSPIAEAFRDRLVRAAGRGVVVKVLLDALGSISLPERFWEPLVRAGGEFRWFNPIQLQRLGFRNHRKAMIVDGQSAFVGGFNIAPEYQGDGFTRGWHDLGLQVPAPLAQALLASFDLTFSLAEYKHRRLTRYRRTRVASVVQTSAGQLLTTAPGRTPHVILTALQQDLSAARRIDIISAYFLPPLRLRRAMARACRQGRPVRLILAGKSDVWLSQLAGQHLYRSLLRTGVEIYEYEPQILHTKFFLFDNIFYVGSANLDKRSLLVNYELLVRVEDPELVREGRSFFDETLRHSRRIELSSWKSARSFWGRWRERWAYFVLSKVDPYLTQLQLKVLNRELLSQQRQTRASEEFR